MGTGMTTATSAPGNARDGAPLLAIGEVARRAAVTTRTLRYYQEMGLLQPSGVTRRGNRLYSETDVERLERILELRDVMGFDLERIRLILQTEDRLAELRAEAQRGISTARRREMVREAMALNARTQHEVNQKLGLLHGFLAELQAKASRYADIAAELGMDTTTERLGTKGSDKRR
jgi:MerR family transcriptional regulator, repressor of the yfmOP operon